MPTFGSATYVAEPDTNVDLSLSWEFAGSVSDAGMLKKARIEGPAEKEEEKEIGLVLPKAPAPQTAEVKAFVALVATGSRSVGVAVPLPPPPPTVPAPCAEKAAPLKRHKPPPPGIEMLMKAGVKVFPAFCPRAESVVRAESPPMMERTLLPSQIRAAVAREHEEVPIEQEQVKANDLAAIMHCEPLRKFVEALPQGDQ